MIRSTRPLNLAILGMLALALIMRPGVGTATDLADLAHYLVSAGVYNAPHGPIETASFAMAVQTGIADALAAPQNVTWPAPVLIRESGLHHSPAVDLAVTPAPPTIALDALQRYLLSADILIPLAPQTALLAAARHATPKQASNGVASGGWAFGDGPAGPSPVDNELDKFRAPGSASTLTIASEWLKAQWVKTLDIEVHPKGTSPLESHYGPAHPGDGGPPTPAFTFHSGTIPMQFGQIHSGTDPGNAYGHSNRDALNIFRRGGINDTGSGAYISGAVSGDSGDDVFIEPGTNPSVKVNLMNLTLNGSLDFPLDTTQQHLRAPLEEDTSCPDPAP